MYHLLSDENFDYDILRGLLKDDPGLNIVTVQEIGLMGASDLVILERAATENRILLTHDRHTMPGFAYDRVRAGLSMPGVFVISKQVSVGDAAREIQLVMQCSSAEEWKDQVIYLPM